MQITPNDIHIWSTSLTMTPERENEKVALLSEDERKRARRFYFPIHQQRYIAARSMLREILSYYLYIPPQEIIFSYTENEKPFLQAIDHTDLQFNLSHSDEIAVYAMTLNHAIGVDIEKIQNSYNEAIAKRFFSPQENSEFIQLSMEDRITGFYRIWSRKEAIVKATGKGLSIPLSTFSVSVHDVTETIDLNQNEKWYLFPLFIHNGYQAAVATGHPVNKITYCSYLEHNKK